MTEVITYTEEELPQRSPEWLQWRKDKITATSACVIMGEPMPWANTPKTWEDLREGEKPIEDNKFMEKGRRLEPKALKAINDDRHFTADEFQPIAIERNFQSGLKIGASLDALSFKNNFDLPEFYEIKVPFNGKESDLWLQVKQGSIPRYYYWQIIHQFLALGVPDAVGHLFVYEEGGESLVWDLDPEQARADASLLLERLTKFYRGEREPRKPGDLSGVKQLDSLCEEYITALSEQEMLKNRVNGIKKKIVAYVEANSPNERKVYNDLFTISKSKKRTMDWKLFREDYPNMNYDDYMKEGVSFWSIRPRGTK